MCFVADGLTERRSATAAGVKMQFWAPTKRCLRRHHLLLLLLVVRMAAPVNHLLPLLPFNLLN
jgi:hypothetical protein